MSRRIGSFVGFALLSLQFLAVDARYYPHNSNEHDYPGHSDLFYVTGSSGFGCQVADYEVIPFRNHERSGEDDGSLWTGETIVQINDRYYDKDGEDAKIVCNGTYHLPTVFWIGPYLQGENGEDNNFAIGMLAFETNDTDKSDAWHVYRPCLSDYIDSDPPPNVFAPSPSAFEIMAAVHYSDSNPPSDNTTIGLSLISHPPGSTVAESAFPQIYFNGTFNDIKEADDYFTDGGPGPDFTFYLEKNLTCTRPSDDKFDWEPSAGAIASILPGSLINGTLSNDTIVLHMTGKTETTTLIREYSSVGFTKTDLEFTFNGRFDARNSSQSLIVNTTSPTVLTFTDGSTWHSPSISLLCGAFLGTISLFMFL